METLLVLAGAVLGLANGVIIGLVLHKYLVMRPELHQEIDVKMDDDGVDYDIDDRHEAIDGMDIPDVVKNYLHSDDDSFLHSVDANARWGPEFVVQCGDKSMVAFRPSTHPRSIAAETIEKAGIDFSSLPRDFQDELSLVSLDTESQGVTAQEQAVLEKFSELNAVYQRGD